MLWRFRREIILIFSLVLGFFLLGKGFFGPGFHRHEKFIRTNAVSAEDLQRENERLSGLLALKTKLRTSKIVFAYVTEISPWVFPTVLRLNKGSGSGVEEGMSVLNRNGFLVGRVTRVEPDWSEAVTLFNPENKVSALVTPTGEIGIVEGESFPYLKIKFLPPDSNIKPGDIVRTSGLTRLFPPGIAIGTIVSVKKSSFELVADGSVKPFFYYDNFKEVALVK